MVTYATKQLKCKMAFNVRSSLIEFEVYFYLKRTKFETNMKAWVNEDYNLKSKASVVVLDVLSKNSSNNVTRMITQDQ